MLVAVLGAVGLVALAATRSRTTVEQAVLGSDDPANTLTAAERAAGWRLLFDGRTTAGWRGYRQDTMPAGWQVVDDALSRVDRAGDIVTVEQFDSFELVFDWQLAEGGNSGVFFRVAETADPVWHTGPEYQVLHNAGHRDGQRPVTSAGSDYAVHPPVRDVTRPVGTWNTARLVVNGSRVEHWMNGVQLLTYELGSDDWTHRVEQSKFAELARFGRERRGHIAIQDHGDSVSYRNIKIRTLPGTR